MTMTERCVFAPARAAWLLVGLAGVSGLATAQETRRCAVGITVHHDPTAFRLTERLLTALVGPSARAALLRQVYGEGSDLPASAVTAWVEDGTPTQAGIIEQPPGTFVGELRVELGAEVPVGRDEVFIDGLAAVLETGIVERIAIGPRQLADEARARLVERRHELLEHAEQWRTQLASPEEQAQRPLVACEQQAESLREQLLQASLEQRTALASIVALQREIAEMSARLDEQFAQREVMAVACARAENRLAEAAGQEQVDEMQRALGDARAQESRVANEISRVTQTLEALSSEISRLSVQRVLGAERGAALADRLSDAEAASRAARRRQSEREAGEQELARLAAQLSAVSEQMATLDARIAALSAARVVVWR